MVGRAFDTLTRRCLTSPSSSCSSATSFASAARTRAAATPGWSTASAPTSACAARPAAVTSCSSAARSSAGWSTFVSRGDPALTAARHAPAPSGPAGVTARRPPRRPSRRRRGPLAVFRNGGFLRLWLSQAATQIGGNMVLFGLTVIVVDSTELQHRGQPADPDLPRPGRAVLGGRRRLRRPDRPAAHPHRDEPPARRWRSSRCTSSATNLALILLLNIFDLDGHRVLRAGRAGDDPGARAAPPAARRERDLHADAQRRVRARVRAARAAGRQGRRAGGGDPRRRRRCTSSPRSSASRCRRRRRRHRPRSTARRARASARPSGPSSSTLAQLREGLRVHPRQPRDRLVAASTSAIAASLVGVLGVLGPDFAQETLGLEAEGLRGRRPAARVRDRDRDPAAQLVRPLLPPPARHRGRADRARHPARGAVRGRPDQPPAPAGRRSRAGSTCRA